MKELLNKSLENTFSPTIEMPTKLQDAAGGYLICVKNTNVLAVRMKKLKYSYVNR